MASDEQLKADIAEIATRPHNVEYSEIERILLQLGSGKPRKTKHGIMFKIPGCKKRLMINKHSDGRNKIPKYCVQDFCQRMAEIEML
jgi:hypothetical protein